MEQCAKTQIKFIKWLYVLPLLIVLSSCDSKMAKKRISFSENPLIMSSEAQTKTVRVENVTGISEQPTDIVIDEGKHIKNDWLEVKFNSPRNIVVTIQENMLPNSRTYKLWVNSQINSDFLYITQNGKTD